MTASKLKALEEENYRLRSALALAKAIDAHKASIEDKRTPIEKVNSRVHKLEMELRKAKITPILEKVFSGDQLLQNIELFSYSSMLVEDIELIFKNRKSSKK